MSDTKYILIYPFESRERAFELANNIDGQLMWQNGNAYPNDNVPAFIIPLSEFGSRWTAPRQIEQLQAQLAEKDELILKQLETKVELFDKNLELTTRNKLLEEVVEAARKYIYDSYEPKAGYDLVRFKRLEESLANLKETE